MIWHRHVAWGEYRPGPRAHCSAPRPMTDSCEPILFPKLRIQFADFPYLHCSID
ncbi:hypothetical protein V1264_024792 [Littorina saxatilis]|uniref:Uncharacterized protein n=1 Tax=Littorina saxatilis TaxID=31220 RepID=A0AAN9AMH0_9CAEN